MTSVAQVLVSPHVGGAAKVALLLDAAARDDYELRTQILAPRGGEAERAASNGGSRVASYDLELLQSRGVRSLAEVVHCALLLRSVDVVHVHSPFVYGALRHSLRRPRTKAVVHVHLDYTPDQLRWALKHPPDLVIACAHFMATAVNQALAAERSGTEVVVVPNAVDLQRFTRVGRSEARLRVGAAHGRPLVMVIANLSPHKGQETAIRAIAELSRTGTRADLWIVGEERGGLEGAYTTHLRALATGLGVEPLVRFLGFRSDVPDLLRAADFVLLPSTSEGMPLTLLEAKACGAIVLAAPTAGVPEVVAHDVDGFLIPHDDFGRYAATLRALIADPCWAARIAGAARQRVEDLHSANAYVDSIFGYYQRLTEKRIARRRVA